jgi:hypothetical protein
MTTTEPTTSLPKLAISCTSADCDNDLHCFRSTRKLLEAGLGGACRICHVSLVDWPRVHERRLDDVDHTFTELRYELIRHHFWHLEFDERARNHAMRKGRSALFVAASRRIEMSVSGENPGNDGRQTPFDGNVLYYAQHATASCCRTCIEYWHGIPKGRGLTADERRYLTGLLVRYIDDRWPDLPEGPTHVPRRTHERKTSRD